MTSDAAAKPQQLKKWVLLIMSLIALTIWMRNLLYVFPSSTGESIHQEEDQQRAKSISILPVAPVMFRDSAGWHDPFSPPIHVSRPTVPRDSTMRQAIAPRPPPPEPPPWKIAGVVWEARYPTAILTSLDGSHRIVVARGDTIGAARIQRIDQSHVWIRHQGRSWKLTWESDSDAPGR